jgi:hypothetical protein
VVELSSYILSSQKPMFLSITNSLPQIYLHATRSDKHGSECISPHHDSRDEWSSNWDTCLASQETETQSILIKNTNILRKFSALDFFLNDNTISYCRSQMPDNRHHLEYTMTILTKNFNPVFGGPKKKHYYIFKGLLPYLLIQKALYKVCEYAYATYTVNKNTSYISDYFLKSSSNTSWDTRS